VLGDANVSRHGRFWDMASLRRDIERVAMLIILPHDNIPLGTHDIGIGRPKVGYYAKSRVTGQAVYCTALHTGH
jgi:hypothetical protein